MAEYRSKFEQDMHKYIKDRASYETERLMYWVPQTRHIYTPDFFILPNIFIETKGLLTVADRKKMILVKEQYPEFRFIFCFMNENTKIRKGSNTTYKMWAEQQGFEVVHPTELHKVK